MTAACRSREKISVTLTLMPWAMVGGMAGENVGHPAVRGYELENRPFMQHLWRVAEKIREERGYHEGEQRVERRPCGRALGRIEIASARVVEPDAPEPQQPDQPVQARDSAQIGLAGDGFWPPVPLKGAQDSG